MNFDYILFYFIFFYNKIKYKKIIFLNIFLSVLLFGLQSFQVKYEIIKNIFQYSLMKIKLFQLLDKVNI